MDAGGPTGVRTPAQQAGDRAEDATAAALVAAGWRILGRHVRAGRSELDLVAVDPGPPPALVVVEVRWRRSREFGLPEETVDGRKVARLWRGVFRLVGDGVLPDGRPLPSLPVRLDLVAVEPSGDGARLRLRHHRGIGEAGRGGAL
jgi:putative endonuclease